MLKRILFAFFSWAVSAHAFAACSIVVGSYWTDAYKTYCPGGTATAVGSTGSDSLNASHQCSLPSGISVQYVACSSSLAFVWRPSCPSGQTAGPNGVCQSPAGASESQKEQARTKARDAAKALGLDQTAQDAAAAKAEAVMDDFIANGKSFSEALAMAEWAGTAAAAENAASRLQSSYDAAVADTRNCYAAGLSGCDAKMKPYYDAARLIGLDPFKAITLYGTSSDGKKLSFTQLPNGSWDVFDETDPKNPKYQGTFPTISDVSASSNTTAPGSSSTSTAQNVATTSPHKAVINDINSPTPKIDYYDQATGEKVATVTKNPNGTVSCTGQCSGIDSANDLYAATKPGSSGGSGSGSGGSGSCSGPDCLGSQPGPNMGFDGSSLDAGYSDIADKYAALEDYDGGGLLSWEYWLDVPVGQCAEPSWSYQGRTFSPFNGMFCSGADVLRQVFAWVLAVITLVISFNIVTRKPE